MQCKDRWHGNSPILHQHTHAPILTMPLKTTNKTFSLPCHFLWDSCRYESCSNAAVSFQGSKKRCNGCNASPHQPPPASPFDGRSMRYPDKLKPAQKIGDTVICSSHLLCKAQNSRPLREPSALRATLCLFNGTFYVLSSVIFSLSSLFTRPHPRHILTWVYFVTFPVYVYKFSCALWPCSLECTESTPRTTSTEACCLNTR